MKIVTNSSLSTMIGCPRKYQYRYEMGLRRERKATALRFGSAYHDALELLYEGTPIEDVLAAIDANYETIPDWAVVCEWQVECETVKALVAGHFWRYGLDNLRTIETEFTFEVPVRNPISGRAKRLLRRCGKIDRLAKNGNGIVLVEYKTASDSLASDSDYWVKLQRDPQILGYVNAARSSGIDVRNVIYDVVHKPTIRPKRVKGEDRKETPQEFGARLADDIQARPEFYYARREIPILDNDLEEYRRELWQQVKTLNFFRKNKAWYRNISKMTCGWCEYKGFCLANTAIDVEHPPVGFNVVTNRHPELTFNNGGSNDTDSNTN